MRDTFRAFADNGVQFTIATDGPEMMRTHLRDEFELLLRVGALDASSYAWPTSAGTRRRSCGASLCCRRPERGWASQEPGNRLGPMGT